MPRDRWGDLLCEVVKMDDNGEIIDDSDEIIKYYGSGNPEMPEFYYVKDGATVWVTGRRQMDPNNLKLKFNEAEITNESESIGGEITITSSGGKKVEMEINTSEVSDYVDFVGCHNVTVTYGGITYVGLSGEGENEVQTSGWIVDYNEGQGGMECIIYGYVGDLPEDKDKVLTIPSRIVIGRGGDMKVSVTGILILEILISIKSSKLILQRVLYVVY